MPKEHILSKSQCLIEEYLIEQKFSRVVPVKSGQLLMRGNIVTNDKVFDTLVDIDKDALVNYPKFYTVDTDMVFYQPHIERPHYEKGIGIVTGMCIINENEKVHYNNPKELIHILLNKYENLCNELSNDTFDKKSDFLKEFDSYWPKNKPDIFMYCNRQPKDKNMLSLITVKSSDNHIQAIIYDDFADINNYISVSKYDIGLNAMCPYIDIKNNFSLPFPSTYEDLVRLFTKSGHMKFIKKLQSVKKIWNILIVGISMPNKKKHYVAVNLTDIKDKRLITNKSIFQVFFSKRYEKKLFEGIHIKSIQRKWLMQRGGNISTVQVSQNNFTVAILGCGSIGSNLAYKLCKSGINNILLIDPDNLRSSNIGRHFLGMNYVGKSKAHSMKEVLQSQFIGMNIQSYTDNAQDCIDAISNVDLIIGAIGSDAPSVEAHIADLITQDCLPPMLSCWLEAEAIAGHGFYVNNQLELNSFDILSNKINILKEEFASSLLQSEVGCNSDYMPYSHLSADEHINKMAKLILKIALDKEIPRAMSSYSNLEKYNDYLSYEAKSNSIKYWTDNEF